jgi:alpha-L-rhamnosidase
MGSAIQSIARRSDTSNFFYFPNDCPHREKNGWTGDACISAEHMLLGLAPERSYRQWLANIRKAQRGDGALPGIVPTGGWGYTWGNGAAWDAVIFELPYQTWRLRGDTDIVKENAHAMLRYLQYVGTQLDADGLISFGLGDWCQVSRGPDRHQAPLRLTNTILTIDMANKSADMFTAIGLTREAAFARDLSAALRSRLRQRCVNLNTLIAEGDCQTSQAMAIYYNIFEPGEMPEAYGILVRMIRANDEFMDVGVRGGRVIFHVLAAFGDADLAYRMITRPEYPSYGNWVTQGATTLWEQFMTDYTTPSSLNHHFWGDVSGWYITRVAGIQVNPFGEDHLECDVAPAFIDALKWAESWHECAAGIINVKWERGDGGITLSLSYPEGAHGRIRLPHGCVFDDGQNVRGIKPGKTSHTIRLTKAR